MNNNSFRDFINWRTGALAAGIVIVLIIGLLVSGPGKESRGTDEYVSPTSPAAFLFKKKNYAVSSTRELNAQIAADVAYFARQSFPVYDPAKNPQVIFNLSKEPKQEGATTSFSGRYADVGDEISVSFTALNNLRIKTTITDKKDQKNIDAKLPSNSAANQFITTLPIKAGAYDIYFAADTGKPTIRLYGNYSESNKQAALGVISSTLGVDYITDANIDIFYTIPSDVSETDVVEQGSVIPDNATGQGLEGNVTEQ